MSDVITFSCGACNKQYKVAASYAGRDFACKACGARNTVPKSAPAGPQPDVQLGSGEQVIRRTTTSGRQVSTADPTRVFTRERETSARLGAVGAEGPVAKGGKGPLVIAAVVIVVVLVGGLGAAIAMGVFDSKTGPANQVADPGQGPAANAPKGETDRGRIFKQLDAPGQTALQLQKLLQDAEAAKLDSADITTISRALVTAILAEQGAGFSDADLMAHARRMVDHNVPMDAESLYGLVIERGKGKEKSAEYKQAREKLGHSWLDLAPAIEEATTLHDSGVVEGVDKLKSELLDMEKRADEGWLIAADKKRFDEISDLLKKARSEYDDVLRNDPFRIKAATAQRQFSLEKASKQAKWAMITREPFVFFVQLQSGENEAAAEDRLESALAAAEQFPEFYREQLVEALELKRVLPSGLSQTERDEAPLVIKLFRDASYLRAHLEDLGYRMEVTMATMFTEPGTGHLSMAYKEHKDSIGHFVRALIDVVMYNYHPRAPATKAEDDAFKAYASGFLAVFFHSAISFTGLDQSGGGYRYDFFQKETGTAKLLHRWRQPFARGTDGRINSFGGQVLTVKDMVGSTDANANDLRELIKSRFSTLEGWTEPDIVAASTPSAVATILGQFLRGLYQFLYHGDDGKYRGKFLKFVRMDLAGEVDKDNPIKAFEKAFGLDDSGWTQLEADFTAFQAE